MKDTRCIDNIREFWQKVDIFAVYNEVTTPFFKVLM